MHVQPGAHVTQTQVKNNLNSQMIALSLIHQT